jgi:hypothetical protein
MKAAAIYENQGEPAKALEFYNRIKNEYPDTNEGQNVEKYIARTTTLLEK